MYLVINGGCLKQDEVTYDHDKIVNIYIVYDLKSTLNYNLEITLENYLFGAVKVTKNADVNKCTLLILVLDLFQELKFLLLYYQYEETNSYLLQRLLHCYQNTGWMGKNFFSIKSKSALFVLINISNFGYFYCTKQIIF